MAAMLTGSEQNWRSFTRSVLSMMTEILLKQAMVGIVGSIGSAVAGLLVAAHPRQAVQPFRPLRRNSILQPEDLREPAANMSQRGLFTVVNLSSRRRQTSRIGVGNLYRLMRGYATGGYVGTPGSMADSRSQASGRLSRITMW